MRLSLWMRCAGDRTAGLRTRALIVLLWRAGLRVSEALALAESDLDPGRGSILVRCGKGGGRREVGMDAWGREHLSPWLEVRVDLPIGALLCVVTGPTAGRHLGQPTSRSCHALSHSRLSRAPARRRFAPPSICRPERYADGDEKNRVGLDSRRVWSE